MSETYLEVCYRHGRPIALGEPANLTVVDPEARWQVDPTSLASLSRNTPYGGVALHGRVRHTILHGRAVVVNGAAQR